jgi:hypothetical protein
LATDRTDRLGLVWLGLSNLDSYRWRRGMGCDVLQFRLRWMVPTGVWVASVVVGFLLACAYALVFITIAHRRQSRAENKASGASADALPAPHRENIGLTDTTNATVIPPAKYDKAQIRKILEGIDAIYPTLTEIERTLDYAMGLAGSLEGIVTHDSATTFLGRIELAPVV